MNANTTTQDQQVATADTAAGAILELPVIPADVTAIVVDVFAGHHGLQTVHVWDRTGREDEDGDWGNAVGFRYIPADVDAEEVAAALRVAGWAEGVSYPYDFPGLKNGTFTHWTR